MKSNQTNIYISAFGFLIMFFASYDAKSQQQADPKTNVPDPTGGTSVTVPYPGIHNLRDNLKYNFIRTTSPDQPLQSMAGAYYYDRISTDFFDGLGRPLQTVVAKANANGNDLVKTHVYDSLGRETYQYLPYAAPTGGYYVGNDPGKLKINDSTQLRGFYDQNGPDEQPYNQTVYENSPLNRVIKSMSPGKSWVGSGRGITYDYKTNSAWSYSDGFNVYGILNAYPKWTISETFGAIPQCSTNYYGLTELSIIIKTDEDGKASWEVKDKAGKIVMKLNQVNTPTGNLRPIDFAYTFYVYDDLGRLRCVLPPEAAKPQLASGSNHTIVWTAPTQQQMDGLCYSYSYDSRNRLVEQKLPGKELEYFVYDRRDRLIMHQDGNLRHAIGYSDGLARWEFTYYDVLDRVTMKTICTANEDGPTMTGYIYDNSVWASTHWLYYFKNYNLINNYPTSIGASTILSYTYYDDYSQLAGFTFDPNQFDGINIPNASVVTPPNTNSNLTRGLITGLKLRIMDPDAPTSNNWLSTVNYYDDKGRVIQTQTNNLQGGIDITSNVYYFQSALYKSILRHQNPHAHIIPGASDHLYEYRVENTFARNLALGGGNDFILKRTQRINSGIDYQLAIYDYDHLGRNTAKQFTSALNLNAYNMRGLLKETAYKDYNQDTFFNEVLFYDNGFKSKLYNGNIAGVIWTGNDQKQKAYGYSYDNLNRLTYAQFKQNEGTIPSPNWSNQIHDYTASDISYDLNGNIQSMNQQVTVLGSNPFPMDQLNYTYAASSNQLTRVNDAISTATTLAQNLPDFKDGTTQGNAISSVEYNFDPNGNLIKDVNKGLSLITYNVFNRPDKITVDTKGTVTYVYDGSGNRLQKRIHNQANNITEVWDYIGNFIYKDTTLQYILNEEGRARPVASGTGGLPQNGVVDPSNPNPTKFIYDYFTRDHLGNVRSVVTSNPLTYPYLASMEIAMANTEELVFDNIPNVRDIKPGSTNPQDGMAAKLNGNDINTRIGTAILLHTNPGDKFQMSVDAFYDGSNTTEATTSPNDVVSSILNTLTGGHTYAGVPLSELPGNIRTVQTLLSNPGLADQIYQLNQGIEDPTLPKAHLTYLWFNDQMQLDMNFSGSVQALSNGTSWQTIGPLFTGGGNNQVVIQGNGNVFPSQGFLLVYIDNQTIGKDVWFDNMLVENYTSAVTDEEHYYPFGLALKLDQTTNSTNPYKYQGISLESHFGLETYETLNRGLDPQLGRFNSIDKMAGKYYDVSPYTSMGNNPVSIKDPLGDTTAYYLVGAKKPFLTINDKGTNRVTIVNEGKENAIIGAYNALTKIFKIDDPEELTGVLNGFGVTYDLKSLGDFYDANSNVPAAFIKRHPVDMSGGKYYTWNGKKVIPKGEINANMIVRNGIVQIGLVNNNKTSTDMTNSDPTALPGQIGKVAHAHLHPFAGSGDFRHLEPAQFGNTIELDYFHGSPGPSDGDYDNASFNHSVYREAAVDQENIYLYNADPSQTITVPKP